MNKTYGLSTVIGFIGVTLAVPALADESNGIHGAAKAEYAAEKTIKGENITGPNDFCGQAIYTFPQPFPDIRLAFFGQLNTDPGATDAIPLSSANCKPDTILATTTDPVFLQFEQGEDTDPSLKNLPIRDVPAYVNRRGLRTHLGRNSDTHGLYPVQFVGDTKDDITLGQWLSAKGSMKYECESQTSSDVEVSLSKLIPNSLYTIWGWYKTVPPGETDATFVVLPLGGVPNTVAIDGKGRSSQFKRHLNYCPSEPTEDGSELLAVVVTWHPDGAVYGAAPSIDFVKGDYLNKDGVTIRTTFPVGVIGQDQMMFPVRLKKN